jgi:hypothetical protein
MNDDVDLTQESRSGFGWILERCQQALLVNAAREEIRRESKTKMRAIGGCEVNKNCTDLPEIQRDCEAMSASRITRELHKFEISVADDGDETYTVVIGNRTHRGLAYVLAQFLHAHRVKMAIEGGA